MSKEKKDKKVSTKEAADKKEKPAKKESSKKKEEKAPKAEAKPKKEEKPKKAAAKEEEPKKDEKAAKVAPKEEAPKEEEKKVEAPKAEPKPVAEAPKDAAKERKPKTAPKEEKVEEEVPEDLPSYDHIKLFNRWSYTGLEVVDPGLKAYISLRPVITPHTGGRYEHQRFKKAEMPIVERLVNKMMKTKKGTGKKERMIKAVKIAFEIIHLQTGKNPIQVLIDAIQRTAPREEVTRITYGGMAQLQSVDVAPMRRVDISLTNIVEGVYKKSFNNILSSEEILARELIDASESKPSSFAIGKMQEIERVALSAR